MKLWRKTISAWLGLRGWFSRSDGDNFRSNRVTLAQFNDAAVVHSPIGLSATWACVNLIAGTLGTLPLAVLRTNTDGRREPATEHPLYAVLHDSPNYDQTAVDFWEFMAASLELHGNAYAEIRRRDNGEISSLIPIRPDLVVARRKENGFIEYRWTENGTINVLGQVDMLHVVGFGGSALGGASTLSVLRGTFNSAIQAEQAAANLFSNGARPSGVLSMDAALTAEQRATLDEALTGKFMGALNAGRPMLLDNGLTWTQLDINPADAQMLESRKFGGEEICRAFGVPPAMVGYGDKASNWGTGKEVDVLGFQKFTLRRRARRIEQALMKQLLTPADRRQGIVIEFNFEGLLRGDSGARAGFYQQALANGWMTINEVRRLENMPPVEGGDVPRMQMQNVPLALADQLAGGNSDAA